MSEKVETNLVDGRNIVAIISFKNSCLDMEWDWEAFKVDGE